MTNYSKLLLALVFGSMSYSTTAKVYSWRGEDGAMHYSQFPRELVEKNNAQSRESRRLEDLADVVDELDEQNDTNLLDGLDDIVANASAVREQDKILKRTAPEVILAAQASALQQTQLEKKSAQPSQLGVKESVITTEKTKPAKQNPFLANIHKRLNKRNHRITDSNSSDTGTASIGKSSVPNSNEAVIRAVSNKPKKQQVQNKFLAEINKKLSRSRLANRTQVVSASKNLQKAGNTKANAGKDLSLSADKIKTIEKQTETEAEATDTKPERPRQSRSALMLSRLSSNHVGRLPFVAAGTDQLDRQGIDSANPFVNDINRAAEK